MFISYDVDHYRIYIYIYIREASMSSHTDEF